ncbi:MAG: hypothetical protein OXE95_07875 [Chloroflexi bacterium]|nr:hypothetical protein [Chloroflexota bacterium]MCY4247475.1 hypothetical protein [Chloroflexota bacterium]
MRLLIIFLLLGQALLAAQAQPSDALAAAYRAAAPFLNAATPPRMTLLREVPTTALGCELIAGLPLAQALDAWRFDFPTVDGDFTVHTSVDGNLAQLCDERVPNLGAGLIPLVDQTGSAASPPQDASCWLRANSDGLTVREVPLGNVVTTIDRLQQHKTLGRNETGDWLFYREGWVKRAAVRLAGSCAELPTLDPAIASSGVIHFCPAGYAGFLLPRISIGRGTARSASATFANRLRASPQPDAPLIAEIPPRQILDEVLDGPACQGSYVWWQVAVAGQVGWTIESDINTNFYHLEPYQQSALRPHTPATQPRPPTFRRIDKPSAPIDTIALLEIADARAVAFSPDGSLLAVVGEAGAAWFSSPDFAPSSHEAVFAGSGNLPSDWLTQSLDALAWSHAGDKLALGRGRDLQVWELPARQLALHYRFPYELRSLAFSRDDRWLAVTGGAINARRNALWIYDQHGELTRSLPLVGAGSAPTVIAAPAASPGDFLYSSADTLFMLPAAGPPRAIYQLAGVPQRAFALAGDSAGASLLALGLGAPGMGWLALVAGAEAHAPGRSLRLDAGSLAFSPDARFLAVATPKRVFVLGTID